MDEAQKQAALSAVRTILGVIGGYVVGKGLASEETVTSVIGAVMALIPFVWGMWNAKRSEEKTQEREAVAVNVGIAVADRTPGNTPPVTSDKAPAVIEAFKPVVPAATENSSTGLSITPDSPVVSGDKGQ